MYRAEPYLNETSALNRYLLSKSQQAKEGERFKKSQQKTDFFILMASLRATSITKTLKFCLLVKHSRSSFHVFISDLSSQDNYQVNCKYTIESPSRPEFIIKTRLNLKSGRIIIDKS